MYRLNSPPPFRTRNPQHTPTPPRRNTSQPSPRRKTSPRQEELSRRNQNNQRNYDPKQVRYPKTISLGILNIPERATEREIKIQYRRLARIYHSDKYYPTTNEMSQFEDKNILKRLITRRNTFVPRKDTHSKYSVLAYYAF